MRASPLSSKSNNSIALIILDCAPGDITHNIPVAGIQMDTLLTIADRTTCHGNVIVCANTKEAVVNFAGVKIDLRAIRGI